MPGKKVASHAIRAALKQDPSIVPALQRQLRKTNNISNHAAIRHLLAWIEGLPVAVVAKQSRASATTVSQTISGFAGFVNVNAGAAESADALVQSALMSLMAAPRGRPLSVVGEKRIRVKALLRESGSVTDAAAAVGVSRDAVYRLIKHDPEAQGFLNLGRRVRRSPKAILKLPGSTKGSDQATAGLADQ